MAHTTASGGPTIAFSRPDADLEDDPIDPEQVLEGNPRARVKCWATSQDQTTSHWTWDCTAGRFRWYTDVDETIIIVEGSARISVDGQEPLCVAAGDSAYFPAGTWMLWEVDSYVRKHAVLRVPVPRGMRYAVNGLGRRTHRL